MKCLVAAGRQDLRKRVMGLLQTRGHDVVACADLHSAWASFESELPALVVLGTLERPNLAADLCRRMRASVTGGRCVLVALVPKSSPEVVDVVRDAGADDYVVETWGDEHVGLRLQLAEERAAERAKIAPPRVALDENEDRYRQLVELSPDGILIQQDECIVYANAEAARILGADTPEDLLGRPLRQVVQPEDLRRVEDALQSLHAGDRERTSLMEWRLKRLDGRSVPCEAAATRFTYRSRPAVQAVFRNVSERRQFREALQNVAAGVSARTGAAFFRSLVQYLARALGASTAMVGEIAPTPTERIRTRAVWSGDDWVDDFEYDLAGTPCENVVGQHYCIYESGVQQKFPKDEMLVDMGAVAYAATPLFDSTGAATGLISVVHNEPLKNMEVVRQLLDIFAARAAAELERLAAEEQRGLLESRVQEAQRLESLGLLAGGIAHDFNNILTGVLGNAGLALLKLRPESPVRPIVKRIEAAAQRAADLTNQMLAYSGKGRFTVAKLDLSALVEEMGQMIEAAMPPNAVLRFDLAEDLAAIEGDAVHLRQAIMNLIANAADALNPEGGKITITTGAAAGGPAPGATTGDTANIPAGPCSFVAVSDSGCGIRDEHRALIFDPFFTTKEMGRGLGLAATLGIANAHGGALEVANDVGSAGGTTVRLLLPCVDPTATATEEATAAPPADAGTILVIEPDDTVRRVASSCLEAFGHRVYTAPDAVAARVIVAEHKEEIGLLIVDTTLPEPGAQAGLAAVRALAPDVPVLAWGSYGAEQAASHLEGEPRMGFLQKPFTPHALIAAVQGLLRKRG